MNEHLISKVEKSNAGDEAKTSRCIHLLARVDREIR